MEGRPPFRGAPPLGVTVRVPRGTFPDVSKCPWSVLCEIVVVTFRERGREVKRGRGAST